MGIALFGDAGLFTLLNDVPFARTRLLGGDKFRTPGDLLRTFGEWFILEEFPFVELALLFKLFEDRVRDTLVGIPNAGDDGRLDCGDCNGGVVIGLFDFDDEVRVGGLIILILVCGCMKELATY